MRTNWITRYFYSVARSLGMKPMAHLKSVNLRGMPANGGGRVGVDGTLYIAKINGRYFMGQFQCSQLGGDELWLSIESPGFEDDGFWLDEQRGGKPLHNWQKLWEFIED